MIDDLRFALVLLGALASGLMAGVFFAFSSFVMTALARLPAAHGIAAMQAINVAVVTPSFMAALFGTGIASLVVAALALATWREPGAAWLLAGTLLYLVGCIGVTMRCNVPRNNALAAVAAESAEGARLWPRYVAEWTAWNHVRVVACLASAAALTLALCR
jgi:uncharacterized membrane protein